MPGELGNEEEQQGVGYYERRYCPKGDNSTQTDIEEKPKSKMILNVIRKLQVQDKE